MFGFGKGKRGHADHLSEERKEIDWGPPPKKQNIWMFLGILCGGKQGGPHSGEKKPRTSRTSMMVGKKRAVAPMGMAERWRAQGEGGRVFSITFWESAVLSLGRGETTVREPNFEKGEENTKVSPNLLGGPKGGGTVPCCFFKRTNEPRLGAMSPQGWGGGNVGERPGGVW